MTCPVCGGADAEFLYPQYRGACITSDLRLFEDAHIENRLCRSCGFIFNAAGVRGRTDEFYSQSYALREHARGARGVNFSGPASEPLAQLQLDFLGASLPSGKGRLLELGAGKGEFLRRFTAAFEGWSVAAVEPSVSATALAESVPTALVHRGGYEDFADEGPFDVIAAFGVVEHVECPVEFLRWIAARMSPTSIACLSMPNFEANPSDLFCIDHLSKLTRESFAMIAQRAGLQVVTEKTLGVPYLAILRLCPATAAASVYETTRATAQRNEALARKQIDAIAAAHDAAGAGDFAIFGLGAGGVFAPHFLGFDLGKIAAYIDENESMHGARVNGRPVAGLSAISGLGVSHIAIAASPLYHAQIAAKLAPYKLAVHL